MSQADTSSPAVALFQRVHGKMVMLQRLDAQLGLLLEQRRKVQQEIGSLQAEINHEIERQLQQADELPSRILSDIAESGRNGEHGNAYAPSRLHTDVERTETSIKSD